MSFLYIFQKGGRLAPYWGEMAPPVGLKGPPPLKVTKNIFCQKLYAHRLIILVVCYFNPIPQI